jgi:aldehyde:ferredoxin oxidoreductase
MMFGWSGKVLTLDLTNRKYDVAYPDPDIYRLNIGGRGLGGHYLKDHITRSWDDPDMPLIFMTGPLVGTTTPTSGRMAVISRSPLTGTIGDSSVGGRFGTELKKAGWDGIIFRGKADGLTGIEIVDGDVFFSDAEDLKGLPVSKIHARTGKKGACAIAGPAAENGVRFANIMFDGHYAAGRNGLGLVFSSKNLKYVSVSGSSRVRVFDPVSLKKAREDILRLGAASPVLMGELGITRFGTAALFDLTHSRRMMPTDNFRKTFFESAGRINAHAYHQKFGYRKTGCEGCHILCKKTGVSGEILPEFETMNHFSALLNNADMNVVVEANRICNDMGMDAISAAGTLACCMEIQNRPLTGNDIIGLLKDMALGRGEGKELGRGAFEYAKAHGKPEAAMTVKKQELPAYDPRGAYGMALGYATSTRGGCHLRAYTIGNEVLRKPVPTDRFSFSGKARIVKIAEDANSVIDSLTACKFMFFAASLEEYARAVSAVTGVPSSGQELLKTGERICYRERMMNHQNGFTDEDDDLPQRFFQSRGSGTARTEIPALSREDFIRARHAYYQIRGLDEKGRPMAWKIRELGL